MLHHGKQLLQIIKQIMNRGALQAPRIFNFTIMKKIFLILALLIGGSTLKAQVTKLTIGVDGFTCSLCAKGIEEQFRSLDFVKSVKTDLKNTLFVLSLKSNPSVNVSQIRDAVIDGGFTVRDIGMEGKGTVRNNGSGFVFTSPNTPDIQLNDVKENISDGDKVQIKGKVTNGNAITVTSIKKI